MKKTNKQQILDNAISEDEYGRVCGRCWNSVCDPTNRDCDSHPIGWHQRWCHKKGKAVESLTPADNCRDYNDD